MDPSKSNDFVTLLRAALVPSVAAVMNSRIYNMKINVHKLYVHHM